MEKQKNRSRSYWELKDLSEFYEINFRKKIIIVYLHSLKKNADNLGSSVCDYTGEWPVNAFDGEIKKRQKEAKEAALKFGPELQELERKIQLGQKIFPAEYAAWKKMSEEEQDQLFWSIRNTCAAKKVGAHQKSLKNISQRWYWEIKKFLKLLF